MTADTRTINRRTVVKGAAWSTPVLAAAMATPALAASPPQRVVDLAITRQDCALLNPGIFTYRRPYFQIVNRGNVTIPPGTQLELRVGTGLNFSFGSDLGNGFGIEAKILSPGRLASIALTEPLAPGATRDVHFLPQLSLVDFGINRNATMSLVALPEGYTDENPANNSTRMSWTGISTLVGSTYSCSG